MNQTYNQEYDIDIIIPTRNRGDLIQLTIESILQNSYTNFKLWIIDQSTNRDTYNAIKAFQTADPRVNYVPSNTKGSNVARSIGVAQGSSPIILFTDDDCRVCRNWVTEMHKELSQPGTSAVFGRVLEDETYKPTVPKHITRVNTDAIHMALKDNINREVYEQSPLNLGFGHGANMGIKRATLKKIGGFDTMLGAGGPFRSWPERDFGYRVLRQNGRIIFTPDSIVYHRHWRGWADILKTQRNYAYGTGAATAKYWRCGDRLNAVYLFIEWIFDQGVRKILSGLLKWRSLQKIRIGFNHIIYPWVGLVKSLGYPINKQTLTYYPINTTPDHEIPPSINQK